MTAVIIALVVGVFTGAIVVWMVTRPVPLVPYPAAADELADGEVTAEANGAPERRI